MDGVTLSFRGVRFAYVPGTDALDLPSLDVNPGLTLLLGKNGSGKTTLMRLAAGVERPDAGTVSIGGRDLWIDEVEARRHLAYVPDQPDLTPYATVAEVLELVARLRGEPLASVEHALQETGLASLRRRTIRELSMGQRHRATLATATIGTPGVVLFDEPLVALDDEMRARVLAWIDAALARRATVLLATHETLPFVAKGAATIRLEGGRLVS